MVTVTKYLLHQTNSMFQQCISEIHSRADQIQQIGNWNPSFEVLCFGERNIKFTYNKSIIDKSNSVMQT